MGLDMYLSAKRHINRRNGFGKEAPSNPAFDQIIFESGLTAYCDDESVNIHGTSVSVIVAYWRKANQIHNWFVNNVQEGNDNCGEYYVSVEQLEQLVSFCKEVLANREDKALAEDLLPPSSGFFFGSEELDTWYYQDLEYTADRLTQLIDLAKADKDVESYVSFTYQSSW